MDNDQYHWSQFGKLPVHSPGWNFPKLQEFTEKPTVVLARLRVLCEQIEKQIPQDVLDRHNLHKKALGDAPITKKGYFLVTLAMKKALEAKYGEDWRWEFGEQYGENDNPWFHLKYYRPDQLPMTEQEWRESQKQVAPVQVDVPLVESVPLVRSVPKRAPVMLNLDFSDLLNEPDSFKRQKEALFRYTRYLKRVPTLDEALALLKEHHLFNGTWEENEEKRRIRVTSILDFIAKTFDASKIANGSVNIGKYDEWAKKKFPMGLTGRKKRFLNEEGKVVEGFHRACVGPKFISVFMSIAEFGLLTDKNQDDSLPHKRAEMVWNALYAKGLISVKFCARKWAVCREAMVRSEIIVITDRNYGPQKAMKWDEGRFFPGLGLWKCKRQPSLLEPGLLFKKKRRERTRTQYLVV